MRDIYYMNHNGEKLDLLGDTFALQTGTFFDHIWETFGSETRIDGFTRQSIVEKELILSVMGKDEEAYEQAMEKFFICTEADVIARIPGKLYYGKNYLTCYLRACELYEWEYDICCTDRHVTLITDYPFWNYDVDFLFYRNAEKSPEEYGYLDYPYDHDYDYSTEGAASYVENENIAESDFTLRMYGQASEPRVKIGDCVYGVRTTIFEGEYCEIDSRAGTVQIVSKVGEIRNAYRYKTLDNSIFQKIPPGKNYFTYNGLFDVSLTLHNERKEPRWNLR